VKEFPAVQLETVNRPENTKMNANRVCAECGATVFADAPQGVCSVCLFRTGLALLGDKDDKAFEPMIARMLKDFGDYELLEEIGRGGQGVVYRARQKSLNRIVALKVIGLAHWATEAHVKRFRLEAEAAASLNHPSIVPIYEVGERDGACYFSMGLVEGGQLDAVAKSATADSSCGEREPIPMRSAAELIAKLARAVHYAHEHGILHRDIKPGNILLDATGEPHLTDFGLARLVETESSVTRTMEVLGTPSYMAPEQAVGNNARVSSATDIYGLGAVLYQLLTGQPPFAGGSTYETVRLVLDTEPRQPHLWNRKIDRDLATICLKCLDKNPQRRYSSALALAEDLERWLKHEPIRARRTGIVTRGSKWVRRNPSIAVMAAMLLILAVPLGVMIWKSETGQLPVSNLAAPEKSIAVLPAKAINSANRDEIYEIGIADSLILKLSSMKGFVIRPLSVMRKYADVGKEPLVAGREQKADYVLASNYQLEGRKIRITAQLLNVASGQTEETYKSEKDAADIFAMQDAIASEVGNVLSSRFGTTPSGRTAKRGTANEEAYRLYLQGMYLYGKRTPADANKAVEVLEQSLRLDPKYAQAWAGLAQAHKNLVTFAGSKAQEEYQKSIEAINKALALDKNLADAHCALCAHKMSYEWDFDGAERECKRAIELDPNFSQAHSAYSRYLNCRGRFDEAIAEIKTAVDLEPASLVNQRDYGVSLYYARRYADAVTQLKRVIAMDEKFNTAYNWLVVALEMQGKYPEAFEWLMKGRARNFPDPDQQKITQALQAAYQTSGWQGTQLEYLRRFEEGKTDKIPDFQGAVLYAKVGNKDKAFEYLEKSYQRRESWMSLLKVEPGLDSVRDDPRFDELIKRVGLK
jgi:serine/threonine protein kinase/Tfp pilus assembly protein PilF